MRRNGRLVLGGIVIVAAIVAFVIANPGSGKKTVDTGLVHISVVGGKPAGGMRAINVSKGGRVHLYVTSDVSDEIHLHGYNFKQEVRAGGQVRFDFRATIDGSFDIELESRGEQIAALNVQP